MPRRTLSPQERQQLSFDCSMSLLGFFLHTFTQLNHLSCPWEERWQRLLSIPFSGSVFIVIQLFPHFFIKYREFYLIVFKLLWFSFPLLRKPKGIQDVLNCSASLGYFGFPLDLLKIAWGSRLFALLFLSLALRQSFVPYVICQLYAFYVLRTNKSICQMPLLKDLIQKKRLQHFTSYMTRALLPMGRFPSDEIRSHETGHCSLTVTFLLLLIGAAIPSMVAVLEWKHMSSKGKLYVIIFLLQCTWAISLLVTTKGLLD